MKNTFTALLLMSCFSSLYSQAGLNFCTSVQSNGECIFKNTKFITSPDSTNGRVYMEVRSANTPIGTASVTFKIYSIAKDGEENFETQLQQNIQANWYFAWMPYTFQSPGQYDVKVYSDSNQIICSNKFELIRF